MFAVYCDQCGVCDLIPIFLIIPLVFCTSFAGLSIFDQWL
jgi:hypothetical protein